MPGESTAGRIVGQPGAGEVTMDEIDRFLDRHGKVQ